MSEMSTAPEIKVVYSASGKTSRAARPRASIASGAYATAVGFVGLLVAVVMFYAIWWPINTFVDTTVIIKTPMPLSAADSEALSRALGGGARQPPGRIGGSAPRTHTEEPAEPAAPAVKYQGLAASNVILWTAYSWQALASAAFCVLALAAGAAWSAGLAARRESVALILAGLTVIGLLSWGTFVWLKHGGGFSMTAVRAVIAGLILLALLLGIGLGKGGRRASLIAGVLLILAAAGSAAGMHLWAQAGALSAAKTSLGFMALVFCIHSAFGWLLLPLSRRLPRA